MDTNAIPNAPILCGLMPAKWRHLLARDAQINKPGNAELDAVICAAREALIAEAEKHGVQDYISSKIHSDFEKWPGSQILSLFNTEKELEKLIQEKEVWRRIKENLQSPLYLVRPLGTIGKYGLSHGGPEGVLLDYTAARTQLLEERVATLSQKLEAQEAESQFTRNRLLFLANKTNNEVVEAHTASRVVALEEENRALKERLATLEQIILGKK